MSHIGIKIKKAREKRGITQKELAKNIHRTRPLISQIERTGIVNDITLRSILQILGLSIDELKGENHEPEEKFWHLKEEIARLRAQNILLQSELDSYRDLVNTQKRLIMMLEKEVAGLKD
jgi:transcriptional regulator with XRE-family HTH domain